MLLRRSIGIGADASLVLADLLEDRQMKKSQLQGTATCLSDSTRPLCGGGQAIGG